MYSVLTVVNQFNIIFIRELYSENYENLPEKGQDRSF
jgi:hypothetical protein